MDLSKKRQEITSVATEMFEKFIGMPKDVRLDDKERTGIQVLVWEPGTRNLVMVSIKEPSEAARFFAVEKAVRMIENNHNNSEKSADFNLMRFPGSVSAWLFNNGGNNNIAVSTSGLKAEEDVAVSVAILAKISGKPFAEICGKILRCEGRLPDWYKQKNWK